MLLREIPEKIGIAVSPITMDVEDEFLPIPLEKKVTVDYRIFTPLEFGEDFKLVYQGTEENLEGDLQDVNKLDTKELRIKAVATTNLPLSLTLSVDALDRNGNNLTGKIVSVDDININAHEGNSPQTEQPVTLVIKPMAGHSIGELLKQLSKFRYRAVAKAKAGDSGKLKEDAFIKLSQIQITLVGGVAYDAN